MANVPTTDKHLEKLASMESGSVRPYEPLTKRIKDYDEAQKGTVTLTVPNWMAAHIAGCIRANYAQMEEALEEMKARGYSLQTLMPYIQQCSNITELLTMLGERDDVIEDVVLCDLALSLEPNSTFYMSLKNYAATKPLTTNQREAVEREVDLFLRKYPTYNQFRSMSKEDKKPYVQRMLLEDGFDTYAVMRIANIRTANAVDSYLTKEQRIALHNKEQEIN